MGATPEHVSAEHMHGSACPGEPVTTEPTVLRGHGTFLRNGAVVASISGPVEYMDRLVTVRPLRSRYVAAVASVGDVVIGRVSEVVLGRAQRWKVDIHSQQHAHLLLSAIDMPGSAQQRRTLEDRADVEMRTFLAEDDLVRRVRVGHRAHSILKLKPRCLWPGGCRGPESV
jgi:exosome complex component RRP4|eukprot:COSAG01_NODE_10543_length_2135_cov_40.082363_2_plen_171_part_00